MRFQHVFGFGARFLSLPKSTPRVITPAAIATIITLTAIIAFYSYAPHLAKLCLPMESITVLDQIHFDVAVDGL